MARSARQGAIALPRRGFSRELKTDKSRDKFKNTFIQLKQSDLQKYKLKYILAKLTQYINEKALGSEAPSTELKNFMKSTLEIEHILPEELTQEVVDSFDKPNEIKDYVYRLGNLALLEKSINASIQNKPFSIKKEAYKQSTFYLTKAISQKVQVGQNTAIDRAVRELTPFDNWTSCAIEKRQELLTMLAMEVWDL